MSWLRDWLNRGRQDQTRNGTGPEAHTDQGEPETGEQYVHIRQAERRQLRRLLKRYDDLQYDLQRAHEALTNENQWTERIEQLNQAVEQALEDRTAVEPVKPELERPQLGPVPVQVASLREAEPAEVTLHAGGIDITYREEIDWAERGHQVALPELRRVEGDVDPLLPQLPNEEIAQELREHLRHSLAIHANQVLEHAAEGTSTPELTLADMTTTCERCGGWLDQKGRCPHCAQLEWKRQEIDADLRRLRQERDEVIHDLERQRERLPIIQRQIFETEADIKKLRDKGVEPAE